MSFKWKDRYNLHIPEIDQQHKRLFEIGNEAYELAKLNDGFDHYDEIVYIIDQLLDYTKYHFEYEEKLMKKYEYVGLDHQFKEHTYYVDKIRSFSSQDIDENQQQSVLEILDFLSEWISSHILISDRKYANDFKERGIF